MRRKACGTGAASSISSVARCDQECGNFESRDAPTIDRYATRPTPTSDAAWMNERCDSMRSSTPWCVATMNTRSPGYSASRTDSGSR